PVERWCAGRSASARRSCARPWIGSGGSPQRPDRNCNSCLHVTQVTPRVHGSALSEGAPMGRTVKTLVAAMLGSVVVVAGGTGAATAESGWWVPTSSPSPDSEVNATGEPSRGTTPGGDVSGYIDAH